MDEEQRIYTEQGVEEYVRYQLEHENEPFSPGPAFPFVKVRGSPTTGHTKPSWALAKSPPMGVGVGRLHLGWINKVLLYNTGNYIQYPVINHNSKNMKKEVYKKVYSAANLVIISDIVFIQGTLLLF